ncbi:MAG TPA: dienelactone hydrolase family protein [Nitrosopumilaceae archaeon]|nr:dienelactone hydrolase family protein [Nitrosopumilaceae archaeon]
MKRKLGLVFLLLLVSLQIQTSTAISENKTLSPRDQAKAGIPIDKILCSEGLQPVMKKNNGNPACVKPTSVVKLIEIGWAIHVLPSYTKDEPKNSEIFGAGLYQTIPQTEMYYENSTGFLARPSEYGTFPGVILIHEWWGVNDNIKEMAQHLASHGYVVLAADLYAGQVATTPDGARQLLTTFDTQKGITNLNSAAEHLVKQYGVDKLAILGWCFGGTQSLNYALSGNSLDATIIYYGQLVTDKDKLSMISWPVLGIFGGQDMNIPVETINNFESSLNDLGIENEIYIYDNVGHGFANPSGANHSPDATKDAWQKTVSFLEKHLK